MSAKAPAIPKTRLNNYHRSQIIKAFTRVFAAKQVDVAEVQRIVNEFIGKAYNLIYNTPDKRQAIKLLTDSGLYGTSITTNVAKLVSKVSEVNTDTGYDEFESIQNVYGLQFRSDRSLPLSNYSEIKVVEYPHDLVERVVANVHADLEIDDLVRKLKGSISSALHITGAAMETYSAVCGMIKSARNAEDLIDLLPEIAPVVTKIVSLVPQRDIVVAPTIEMREVLAKLTPIEMDDAE